MFSPFGRSVPNLKINLISCCLRLMLLPAHCFKPQTMMSSREWEAELNVQLRENPRDRFRILRRCSPSSLPDVQAIAATAGDATHNILRLTGHGCYVRSLALLEKSEELCSCTSEHFNSASHSLDDIMVCGLKPYAGSNMSRKQHEMRLIFKLGTLRPNGLNINFNFR